jgi:hypothetical protein
MDQILIVVTMGVGTLLSGIVVCSYFMWRLRGLHVIISSGNRAEDAIPAVDWILMITVVLTSISVVPPALATLVNSWELSPLIAPAIVFCMLSAVGPAAAASTSFVRLRQLLRTASATGGTK